MEDVVNQLVEDNFLEKTQNIKIIETYLKWKSVCLYQPKEMILIAFVFKCPKFTI